MKVLILSCNTGQGHNAAGLAMLETFKARKIDAQMKDALIFKSENVSKITSNVYTTITTKSSWFFGCIYHAGRFISSSKYKSPVYLANTSYAKKMYEYLRDNQIDVLVAPHLFPAEAATYIRRHYDINLACYAIATDYACIPFWEETEMDYYFIPENMKDEFLKHGISENKLVLTGIPVSKNYCIKEDKARLRQEFGISETCKVYLIMSGSMGFGNIIDIVHELAKISGDNSKIIVLGGRNEALKSKLRSIYKNDLRITVMDFTDKVPQLLKISDVLLTKPGGLTSTEAALSNIPIIHTAPIPGCETLNARFFNKENMSVLVKNPSQIAKVALDIVTDDNKREKMIQAQRLNINPHAADDICDFIISRQTEGIGIK